MAGYEGRVLPDMVFSGRYRFRRYSEVKRADGTGTEIDIFVDDLSRNQTIQFTDLDYDTNPGVDQIKVGSSPPLDAEKSPPALKKLYPAVTAGISAYVGESFKQDLENRSWTLFNCRTNARLFVDSCDQTPRKVWFRMSKTQDGGSESVFTLEGTRQDCSRFEFHPSTLTHGIGREEQPPDTQYHFGNPGDQGWMASILQRTGYGAVISELGPLLDGSSSYNISLSELYVDYCEDTQEDDRETLKEKWDKLLAQGVRYMTPWLQMLQPEQWPYVMKGISHCVRRYLKSTMSITFEEYLRREEQAAISLASKLTRLKERISWARHVLPEGEVKLNPLGMMWFENHGSELNFPFFREIKLKDERMMLVDTDFAFFILNDSFTREYSTAFWNPDEPTSLSYLDSVLQVTDNGDVFANFPERQIEIKPGGIIDTLDRMVY